MNEQDVIEEFKSWVESHPNWRFKSEVPVGELRADGRVEEIDENGIVKNIICYIEAKGPNAGLTELLTGLAQAQYVREHTLIETWLVINHEQVQRLLAQKKKAIGGIKLFDIDNKELIDYETVVEKMSKSRVKRAQEFTINVWKRDFTIETISPIAITNPEYDGDNVLFNIGQRIRGMLKEIAKTISNSLSEAVKYSIYVEPLKIPIAKKKELKLITEYVPTSRGQSSKREMYEVPPGKRITFTVRCIGKRLTPELVENLIIQGGMFCGIGDSHSDGYHGRFNLITVNNINPKTEEQKQ